MHKGAKFRQIGDAKQLVCMIFLKKQSRRRQDMKTILFHKISVRSNTVFYDLGPEIILDPRPHSSSNFFAVEKGANYK